MCHQCKQIGHIKPVCGKSVNLVEDDTPTTNPTEAENPNYMGTDITNLSLQWGSNIVDENEEVNFGLYMVEDASKSQLSVNPSRRDYVLPYKVTVSIDTEEIEMEIDTGASRSTVSDWIYKQNLSQYKLQKCEMKLRGYNGEMVPILGQISIPVCYGESNEQLTLIVVKGILPSLFGRINGINGFSASIDLIRVIFFTPTMIFFTPILLY